MPIKTRIDMLTTGVRTPIGIKVLGDDLAAIERAGVALESVLSPIRGTRSAFYERNLGGLYIDIVPDRDALARLGLTVGDLQRTIEAAIGGTPVLVTIEGRARYTVNVRYPQDVRSDLESLRALPVPAESSAAMSPSGPMGALPPGVRRGPRLAQMDMGDAARPSLSGPPPIPMAPGGSGTMSDVGMGSPMGEGQTRGAGAPSARGSAGGGAEAVTRWVPLGQIADVRIANGPPMVRDENGRLVGYVYVDVDTAVRDIGGYVAEAKRAVARARREGRLPLGAGMDLEWTGQYELLAKTNARLKVVVPLALAIIVLLLWLHFRNGVEVLIVLCSIPFALVGSIWAMYLFDYRFSTAVWVGVIALAGLAAQTGIVMIVYIDHAFERRKAAGKIRNLQDIVWAHMEGTVQRVRPKLMTVATMLVGLLPLLWSEGSGADVMKRIAAPMVGGLVTSAFLTLEVIPVIYTYWRWEQLLWERLTAARPVDVLRMRTAAIAVGAAIALAAAVPVARIYVTVPGAAAAAALALAALAAIAGAIAYLVLRAPAARAVSHV
jgi:Cu(I)/Ag(I) efflux system membrane protein CusA/SilA